MTISNPFFRRLRSMDLLSMNEQNSSPRKGELMTCPNCGNPMDISGMRPFAKAVCNICRQATRVHMQLGVYRILDCVGRGGMSEIFRAEDTILGRIVALKILNENYSRQKDRVEKFEQEAQIMAKVQHEHIVKVYTVGRAFDHVFIAMELVNGRDLETLMKLRGEPIPEPEALEISIQSVDGLMAADAAGLVHRDVKPANILLDTSGKCKIVDFGLSLLQTEKEESNEIWVTPYYASPEALRREFEDSRSDMYALGVTMFQMLTGKTPFETVPGSVHALLDIKKKLPSIRNTAPELSPMTRRIVDKLMHYDKEKRYQSYTELKEDLVRAHALLGTGGEDWKVRRSSLVRKYKRNRARMIAAYCVAGIVMGGGISFWAMREPKVSQEEVHVLPAKDTEAPVVHMMSGEDIGKAYLRAQETLKSGYLEDARRQFEVLLDEQRCPLTTASWAGLNAAYACWILGDEHRGRFLMQRIVDRISKENPADSVGSAVDVMGLMKVLLVSSQDGAEMRKMIQDDNIRSYAFVGMGLKAWQEGDVEKTADFFGRLKILAASEENVPAGQGVSARSWKVLLTSYLQDLSSLEYLMSMPDKTLELAKSKLVAIQSPPVQQSPGSTYKRIIASLLRKQEANIKDLSGRVNQENRSQSAGKEEDRKEKKDTAQGQSPSHSDQAMNEQARKDEPLRRSQDGKRQKEENLLGQQQHRNEQVETARKSIRNVEVLMKDTWKFGSAVNSLHEIEALAGEDDALKGKLKSYLEMASLADEFLNQTMEQALLLPPAKKQIVFKDGEKALLMGFDRNMNLAVIKGASGRTTRPVYELGVATIIKLHRFCATLAGMKQDVVRKRHRDAFVFMFLAGEREQAMSGMEKWLLSNSDITLEFMDSWQGWMLSMDEEGKK